MFLIKIDIQQRKKYSLGYFPSVINDQNGVLLSISFKWVYLERLWKNLYIFLDINFVAVMKH